MENDELSLLRQHINNILNWEKKFKSYLSDKKERKMELFPIDKEWYEDYKKAVFSDNIQDTSKLRNYNNFQPIDYSHILYNKKNINPDSNFVLLNKESYKSFSPNLLLNNRDVRVTAHFSNKKMISQIGPKLYYFYYLDKNKIIKEGFFIFEKDLDDENINLIINDFMNKSISSFIQHYFKNTKITEQKNKKSILYHLNNFDFIIKNEINDYINHNKVSLNTKASNLSLNDSLKNKRNCKVNNINNKSKIKDKLKEKEKDNYEKIKNNTLRISSPQNNILYNLNNSMATNNSIELNKNISFINKRTERKKYNIIDCIYEYFYSQIEFKNFINENKQRRINLMPINKEWLDEFCLKCKYNKIEAILSNENNSLKFKQIINNFLNDNYLYNVEMSYIPKIKICSIKNNYKYFTDYKLITKKAFEIFLSNFGSKVITKEFVIFKINNNYIIIKYNSFSAEIQDIKCKEKYYIFSDEFLDQIINNIVKKGIVEGFKLYGVFFNKKFFDCPIFSEDKSRTIGYFMNINYQEIIQGTGEDDEIINNEEEVYDNQEDKSRDIINIIQIDPNNFNKFKSKRSYSPQCSLNKNINIVNFINMSKNKTNSNRNNRYPNLKNSNGVSFVQNFPKCPNTPKNTNNLNLNSIIYTKKNNIPYKFEQMTKSKDNQEQSKLKTPMNKSKNVNYYDNISTKKSNNTLDYLDRKNIKNSNNKNSIYKIINPSIESEYKNTKGLVGLSNIGATCYMNATIQCLSNIPRLREKLLNENVFQELYYGRKGNKKLSFSLANIFKNLWLNKMIQYFPPEDFKNVISDMNPLFKGIAANDAKDLILFILETIHNELNCKFHENYHPISNNLDFFSVFNDFRNYYTNNNQSIISEEFYGYFNSMMKCCSCNVMTHNVQVMHIIFFPLEEVRKFVQSPYNYVTLDNCFEFYQKPELLKNSNQIYCNYCKRYSMAYNQNKIIISPKTIIIVFNRGKGLQYNVGIQFEKIIDLKKYIFNNNISPFYYELVGVISHIGSNDMGGHFIAFCKNSYDCEWYKYNDESVNKSSFQEIRKFGLPYVLFYSYIKT